MASKKLLNMVPKLFIIIALFFSDEFSTMLRVLGLLEDRAESRKLFNKLKLPDSKKVDYTGFKNAVIQVSTTRLCEKSIRQAFRQADVDSNDSIDKS